MAITKMFVEYQGTKAQFDAVKAQYADKIVFITGDADGANCIYARGEYFGNFTELFTSAMAAVNYAKGIKIGTSSYNVAAGGGYIGFEATDPSTVAVNAGQNGVTIGLTSAFVNKVNNTATDLGSKTDAANKDGSAFARIANLAALVSDLTGGSTDSIEGQITTAINNLRTEIVGTLEAGDSKTLEAINNELDALPIALAGSSSDLSSANTFSGVRKYADEKIAALNSTKTGASTHVNVTVKQEDGAITEVSVTNTDIASADTLAAVKAQVDAFFAGADISETADKYKDTLKELQTYMTEDAAAATQMTEDIAAIKNYSVNGQKFSEASNGAVTLGANNISYAAASGNTSASTNVGDAIGDVDDAVVAIQNTTINNKAIRDGNITLKDTDITIDGTEGVLGGKTNVHEALVMVATNANKGLGALHNAISADSKLIGVSTNEADRRTLTITPSASKTADNIDVATTTNYKLATDYAVKAYVEAMLGWDVVKAQR